MTTFYKTTESYQQGARTLPGRYYTAAEVAGQERERIFRRRWVCVGRAAELAEPGDFKVVEIAGESIIVLRDQEGTPRAFYNVCRHRGTQLCEAATGRLSETIQCPYHAWTYKLDGQLIGAPHMNEVAGFEKRDYPLHTLPLETWEGFLFVTLSPEPSAFAETFAPLATRFSRFHLPSLRAVRKIVYEVQANWKLIMQNYSECLHCPTIHPELSTKLPYTSGANDLVEGPFLGGYMQIKEPNESATMSGRACGLPLGDLSADDRHRAFYYTLFPTMMLSVHPDYAVFYTVWPLGPTSTRVVCEWMVHPDSPNAPGYHIEDAAEFWDRTNRQDWHICEMAQRGVSSRAYTPGPYSPRESMPAAWDREYLKSMEA
jgi:glycine betaine catabolism A